MAAALLADSLMIFWIRKSVDEEGRSSVSGIWESRRSIASWMLVMKSCVIFPSRLTANQRLPEDIKQQLSRNSNLYYEN